MSDLIAYPQAYYLQTELHQPNAVSTKISYVYYHANESQPLAIAFPFKKEFKTVHLWIFCHF